MIEDGETILDKEEYLPSHDRWNLTSKVPWENDDGEIVGLIGVTRDITEHKRAQQELHEKTERLDNFADVVSHDLRNPLNVARGYVNLATEVDDAEDHLDEAAAAIDRASDIVDDVLALSRHGRGEINPESVSLNALARGAWSSVDPADATLSVPDEETVIEADRSQLRRLLENLFKNAVQHGGPDVSVRVRVTDDEEEDEEEASAANRSSDDKRSASGVRIVVDDDGPGIPEAERERVFETAYTTHEDGTGFGLAIVTEIAAAHGWSVSVDESEAGGARFELSGVERAGDADD